MKSNCKKLIILAGYFFSVVFFAGAQNVRDSSLFIPMIKFSYAFQVPGGDLAKRFGTNSAVGANFSIKTKKNIFFGADGSFFFGNHIHENGILDSLRTSTGFIINQNGNPSIVRMFERGFTISMHVGMLFPVLAKNKNSGILAYMGPTFLRHKITIDDVGRQSPQLTYPYLKGYDRLTTGFGLHEFIGYVYLGNNRIVNFFGGFDFVQALTKSQRSYDYDLMRADTAKRIDLLFGIKIGWLLPLYRRTPQAFYYH